VKRKVLLIGVPLVVLAAWAFSGARGTQGDAEVDISAQHPIQLRGAVVAALNTVGGVRVGEDTKFDGAGSSQLKFDIPTARIEEATQSLGTLGGHVTNQQIDLSNAADAASGVTQKLTEARTCVSTVGAVASSAAAREQLARCSADLTTVAGRLNSSKVDLTTSVLLVKISPISGWNPALAVAILLLIIAAVGIGLLMWRTDRFQPPPIDVREMAEYDKADADLHLRRN
jgi:hypothetical protein